MKTYCPHCGALNNHGLTKPIACARCNQNLEMDTPPPKPIRNIASKPRHASKILPRKLLEPIDEMEDGEEDAEIPENIASIEIESVHINRQNKIKIKDIAGKRDASSSPRPIIKMSKKKQLEEFRNECRSTKEKPPRNIE